jgi:pilus assembly protein Flp/PilA
MIVIWLSLKKSIAKHPEGKMIQKLINFFKDEEGASAVEYGILVAAVAAVIIVVMLAIGGKVSNGMEAVNGNMTTAPFGGS